MNSEMQILVKLEYVHATCNDIMKLEKCKDMAPTLLWMIQEVATVFNRLIYSVEPRKRLKRAKEVNKVASRLMEIEHINPWGTTKGTAEEEDILLLLSIVTQMLEDISLVKRKKHFVQDVLTAAYTLESLVKLPKNRVFDPEDIYSHAGAYLENVYSKLAEIG